MRMMVMMVVVVLVVVVMTEAVVPAVDELPSARQVIQQRMSCEHINNICTVR